MKKPTYGPVSNSHIAKFLAVCTLVISAPVFAEPPIPVDESRTQPALLRYSFTPGSEYRYHVASEVTNERLTISNPVVRANETATVDFDLRVLTEHLDAEGNSVIAAEVSGVALSMRRGDNLSRVARVARQLEGTVTRARVSPLAEVLEVSEEQTVVDFDAAALLTPARLLELKLPETAVQLGGTWENTEEFAVREGIDLTSTDRYTFLGYAVVDGRVFTVLQIESSRWVEVADETSYHGVDGPALGRGIGTGYVYLDPAAGRIERMYLEGGMVMRTTEGVQTVDLISELSLTVTPLGP